MVTQLHGVVAGTPRADHFAVPNLNAMECARAAHGLGHLALCRASSGTFDAHARDLGTLVTA